MLGHLEKIHKINDDMGSVKDWIIDNISSAYPEEMRRLHGKSSGQLSFIVSRSFNLRTESRKTLAAAFAVAGIPFAFVESPLFQQFLHDCGVQGKLPSRKTLSRDVDTLHKSLMLYLSDLLRDRISP
jgi:hypothetical protein